MELEHFLEFPDGKNVGTFLMAAVSSLSLITKLFIHLVSQIVAYVAVIMLKKPLT